MVDREEVGTAYPDAIAELGSVGDPGERRAEWRVAVFPGPYGPRIDVRRWLNPPRPEDVRAYVPKGKGRGRVPREPFVGATKAGARFEAEDACRLATLILEAAGIGEDWQAGQARASEGAA